MVWVRVSDLLPDVALTVEWHDHVELVLLVEMITYTYDARVVELAEDVILVPVAGKRGYELL
jgi:hypothetical protein